MSFPNKATRAKGILELIHIHVFGNVTVPSLGGFRYYLSFINNFSRMTWIYFLKKKSKVFERLLEFKSLEENQTDRKIKVLRNDNGGVFYRIEFDQFCKQHGIARQNITPYMPQQNKVAERMNRTLMKKARSMISDVAL